MIKLRHIDEFCEETKHWSNMCRGSEFKIPVMDLDDRLRRVEKRLLILEPDPNMLSKFPALKEAYEHYKIIEGLTIGNEG